MKSNRSQRELFKNNIFKWFFSKRFGLKRRFILTGIFVASITNIVLLILLIFFNPYFSTLVSQSINAILGYSLYSKKVFFKKINTKRFIIKYLICSILIWNSNFFLINYFISLNINVYLAAIFAIPLMACASFLIQKYFVFK